MKTLRFLFTYCALLLFGSLSAQDNTVWRLAWSDEFNGDTINWNCWSKVPRGKGDWKKHAADYDTLYAIENGDLVLRAIRNTSYPTDTATCLTGDVCTLNKKTFGLGRIEIRAWLGHAQGFWPAIWMLPNLENRHGSDEGEIDIMEHLNSDSIVYQTVHSYYTLKLGLDYDPPHYATANFDPDEYNVFAVERYDDSLVFLVNGQRTFCYPRIVTDKEGQFPFADNDFFLILSAQLGGSWVGPIDESQLPTEMRIDYVRYYKKAEVN